ncbi:aldehyde dehydrogenase family protein, partial [Streptomyces sp. NPDC005568]|uniref:aldehyde dehydrogenase family protein n=1 Tax=Streptomyces sp. NPDC005568 TaxID=3156887 RepID=UPI0033B7C153
LRGGHDRRAREGVAVDRRERLRAVRNDTEFGLAGAVWTTDVGRAHRVAAQVNAGTFWVNGYKTINVASPFGGYGLSGYGRSSGVEALYEYTQTKSVWSCPATCACTRSASSWKACLRTSSARASTCACT